MDSIEQLATAQLTASAAAPTSEQHLTIIHTSASAIALLVSAERPTDVTVTSNATRNADE